MKLNLLYISVTCLLWLFPVQVRSNENCILTLFEKPVSVLPEDHFKEGSNFFAPHISPSDRYLAYSSGVSNPQLCIFSFKTSTSTEIKVTKGLLDRGKTALSDFHWRPLQAPIDENDYFVFVSLMNKNQDLYIGEVNNSVVSVLRLTTNEAIDYQPRWSPDGNSIVFVSTRNRQNGADLYLINDINSIIEIWKTKRDKLREKPPRLQDIGMEENWTKMTSSDKGVVYPAWSPDGKSIAYSYWTEDKSNSTIDIAVITKNSTADEHSNKIRITSELIDFDEIAPSWSNDGNYIAFYSNTIKDRKAEIESGVKKVDIGYCKIERDGEDRITGSSNCTASIGIQTADAMVNATLTGPVWDIDSNSIYFVKDDHKTYNPLNRFCIRDKSIDTFELGVSFIRDYSMKFIDQKKGFAYFAGIYKKLVSVYKVSTEKHAE